jgi:hypothetical protein
MQEFFLVTSPEESQCYLIQGKAQVARYAGTEGRTIYKLPELEEVKSVEIEVKMKEKKK